MSLSHDHMLTCVFRLLLLDHTIKVQVQNWPEELECFLSNGPFRKLSRAMLVTSFGGQCRKKTAIFYECEGFLRRLRVQNGAL